MALNKVDVQNFLGADDDGRSNFHSDSGDVGRASIDGVLVIYDLNDIPAWFAGALKVANDDGDTPIAEPRMNERAVLDFKLAATT